MKRSSRAAILAAALVITAAGSTQAQGGVLIQGIVDLEAWATDTSSTLLIRNGGNPGGVYRLHLWSAVEPWRGLFVFAQTRVEGGNARSYGDRGTHANLEQGGVRFARDPRAVLNAGKMYHPLGVFAPRIFSTRNPLIGIPDGYSPVYPIGGMLNGELGHVDYRAAAVSHPLTHRDYVPSAGAALRPVLGVGLTPIVGLRFGASATSGPYLSDNFSSSELNGRGWRSYRQRIIAGDAQYGVGHFDLRAEYAHADFEVPYNGWIDGNTAYVEGRYTVTPRVFVAARGEVNDYPFIRNFAPTTWVSRRTEFKDVEAGVGFRIRRSTLLKASYRIDDWVVTPANANFVRSGGQAIALQLSQAFDVMEWVSWR